VILNGGYAMAGVIATVRLFCGTEDHLGIPTAYYYGR